MRISMTTVVVSDDRPPRRGYLYALIFLLLILLSGLAVQTAQAQDDPNTPGASGTNPSGTLPENPLYLPLVALNAGQARVFDAIPVLEPPVDRPAAAHGDLNLALRGYTNTVANLTLIDVNGDVDEHAPQLAGLFATPRLPTFQAAYRVYDWNWGCSAEGCRGEPLADPPVTLLEMVVTQGEALHIPTRTPDIYGGDYKALVLYAEAQRITLAYTRQDTAAVGYLVHIEDLTVDPALVALYNELNLAGRSRLPALRNGEVLGLASGTTIKVAIRDTGAFMDPRVRKDWWKGY